MMTPAACRTYLRDLRRFGVKLGLDNIRVLLASFDDPQKAFPIVHVAGTNGKGSVCAMLAEILSRAGYKAGLYTSPHLVRLEERIRIGGQTIPERHLRRLLEKIKKQVEALSAEGRIEAPPTFFEVITIAALLYFRERNVDVAVLEVGMGGRFDATNVVVPLVSVITTISKDHMEYLGKTLAAIAFEKAGIIKPGVPVVSGLGRGPARSVVRRRAAEDGAPLIEIFGPGRSLQSGASARRPRFLFRTEGETYRFTPGLPGAHQGRNAAVAVLASRILDKTWKPVGKTAVEAGIERAVWEGRLEQIGRRPRVFLDGAHNEDGAAALARFIEEECPRPPVLVVAIMRDKAVSRIAGILFPLAKKAVLTTIPYERAARPEEILAKSPVFRRKLIIEPDHRKALALARRLAGPAGTVFVTGSLFLVGAVKKAAGNR